MGDCSSHFRVFGVSILPMSSVDICSAYEVAVVFVERTMPGGDCFDPVCPA